MKEAVDVISFGMPKTLLQAQLLPQWGPAPPGHPGPPSPQHPASLRRTRVVVRRPGQDRGAACGNRINGGIARDRLCCAGGRGMHWAVPKVAVAVEVHCLWEVGPHPSPFVLVRPRHRLVEGPAIPRVHSMSSLILNAQSMNNARSVSNGRIL